MKVNGGCYGTALEGNYLKIGNGPVFVLFRRRFAFGIIMRWSPSHSDAITTLRLVTLLLSSF